MSYTLPTLPYAYNALEPFIDEKTMQIHHDLHHGTYVNKLNAALEKNPELATLDIEVLLSELDSIPEEIRQAVINHGGGHANHSLFWQIMGTPTDKKGPSGELLNQINNTFGNFNDFKLKFTEAATTKFGSG
jgi:superoxide dismutase, Fe-Mn family